ncbi:MAG: glycosyltransferase [Saprospiraceae bacterium]|jgi:GT2 family glycosyltransferase|nr:glycosyltransferase [Saprospiraceae bacterium]
MLNQLTRVSRSPDNDYRFSILIPSWNNLEYLQLCVESIRRHSAFPHQIIVHVNEGNDGTLAWLDAQTDLDYTWSRDNIGICYSLNFARSLAKAEYLCYLNDDMVVLPGWDKHLCAEIDRIGHRSFILSGTAIEPRDTGNPCVLVQDYGDSPDTFEQEKLLREFRSLEKADWAGSTWPPIVLHRDLWDLVGGLSIEFSPGMYSDPDLSMKLWQAGVRYFKGLGQSRVYHFGSKSTKRKRMNTGRDRFLMKWGISSSTFSKKYLRRGALFSGPLAEPALSSFDGWKSLFKRLQCVVRQGLRRLS